MNALRLATIAFFYVLVACIVLFRPLPETEILYVFIIALSVIFIGISGLKFKPGNLLPGSIAGSAGIFAVFLTTLAAGGIVVTGISAGALTLLVSGILVQALVATGEELAFRQYIFAELERFIGRSPAIAISAAAFSLLHLPAMYLLGTPIELIAIALTTIFIGGAVMALLYANSGIMSSIGFHFFWNYLQYSVFGLGFMSSALLVQKAGNPMINGGTFGPEASIPGLIIMILLLIGVWYYYRPRANLPADQDS